MVDSPARSHRTPPPERSLAVRAPHLAREWDLEKNAPLTPRDVFASSDKKAHWIGSSCGHSWLAVISSRTNGGNGCPYCANQRILPGFNDLASQNPRLAADWHPSKNGGRTPRDVTAFSGLKAWWKCSTCSWEWNTSVVSRTDKPGVRSGHGCPSCAGQRCRPGKNDLTTMRPDLTAEWDHTRNLEHTPDTIAAKSGVVVWWRCAKAGHPWKTRVISRTGKHSGCPTCSGRVPEPGVNDLATTHPDLKREWHPSKNAGLRPTDVSAGADKIVHWRCRTCSHEWSLAVKKRALVGTGCSKCNPHGTSKIEQALSSHVADRGYIVAEQRRLPIPLSPWHPRMECDIILHNEKIVIEYDGFLYHSREGSPERDERKTQLLLAHGWSVIRVRNNIPLLPLEHPHLRQITYDERSTSLEYLTDEVTTAIRALAS